jgi:polygalacturonase
VGQIISTYDQIARLPSGPVTNLKKHGGKAGDATFDNTAALTAAIAAVNTAGGGTVQVGDGVWWVAPLAASNYVLV